MHRIAVLGANGQVGSELCLLLSGRADAELVPICRNPTGSAFLRYSGIPCRHGRPSHPDEAARLIGDCDVILNCALGTGTPQEIRAFDRALIRSIFDSSAPHATIIHCSTLMVHGDPRPNALFRARDAYGRAKSAAEKRIGLESRRAGKAGYVLRLGHVCGELQNITAKIRDEIRGGRPVLPERDVNSNVVYTATIVDAIMAILAGRERPGTYDLTNEPQWTWREVYQHEAARLQVALTPELVPDEVRRLSARSVRQALRGFPGRLLQRPFVRRQMERVLAIAPAQVNDRAQAVWFKMRARSEIRQLHLALEPSPELSWIDLNHRPLSSLRPTRELLAEPAYITSTRPTHPSWPLDLPPANPASITAAPREQLNAPWSTRWPS